jgi:16S rRNA (guanine966-N2)-methyltransferase
MKDRVRESVFNLLGPGIVGTHAIDLFAGTGALGLEAVSRGAARGTLIERHLPTCRLIEQNVAALGVGGQVQVVFGDAFVWTERFQPDGSVPVAVFISPPFDFYVDKRQQMLDLIEKWVSAMPADSQLVVEADDRFDLQALPTPERWDVREYAPAVVAILKY